MKTFVYIAAFTALLYIAEGSSLLGKSRPYDRASPILRALKDEEVAKRELKQKAVRESHMKKKGIDLTCKEMNEECQGAPKCCGTTQCYFEGGYSLSNRKGVCVECVDRSLSCQRSAQCCSPLVCQKDGLLDVNGICDVKMDDGERCFKDKQCESDNCDKARFWHTHGTCQS